MPYGANSGDVAAITMEGIVDGQQILTITHWRLNAVAPSVDGRLTLFNFMNRLVDGGQYCELWRACLSVRATNLTVKGQFISAVRHGFLQRDLVVNVGAVGGQSEPVNVAVSITRRTDEAGRRERGTIHMPGVPNTFLTNSTVNALGLAAYSAFGVRATTPYLAVEVGRSFEPVPFHRVNPLLVQEYTNYFVQPFSRVQRRRTVGLGS